MNSSIKQHCSIRVLRAFAMLWLVSAVAAQTTTVTVAMGRWKTVIVQYEDEDQDGTTSASRVRKTNASCALSPRRSPLSGNYCAAHQPWWDRLLGAEILQIGVRSHEPLYRETSMG